jgi:hypothetical protein
LIVEWKVSDVDRARAAQFGRRWPEDVPVVADHGLAVHIAARVIVGTVKMKQSIGWMFRPKRERGQFTCYTGRCRVTRCARTASAVLSVRRILLGPRSAIHPSIPKNSTQSRLHS